MHIHLPKPLHGWRAFANEIAIIVIGVLIALALEQAVEWIHKGASAQETRASVRGEIADNLQFFAGRKNTEDCVQRRLREIAVFLDATDAHKSSPRPTWIGAPFAPLAGDIRFKAAQSAGKFFLLSQGEQQTFAGFYVDGDDFNAADTRELYDWAQLRSLANPDTRLSDTEITRLRQALEDARAADYLIRLDTEEYIKEAHAIGLGVRPRRLITNQIASVCLPSTTPYADGAAKAGTKAVPFPE
jgi:uncharacterized membrane protein